jgi:transcriptional regulator with XRE-family HTH domain
LQRAAHRSIISGMAPHELIAFRKRMGWDRAELARQLGISPSRIADYEGGHTRGRNPQPAPIPKVVELACRFLGGEQAPLSDAEWLARWRDVSGLPDRRSEAGLAPADDSREAIYDDER